MDEAFLEAIARSPEDPGPRLVYADAVSARQDPHGELIVLQHTLARASAADLAGARGERLRFRERQLVIAVAKRIGLPPRALSFELGFVRKVDLTPFLPEVLARAFAHPAMRFVRALSIHQHDAGVVRAVSEAPFTPSLRSLSGSVSRDLLDALVRAGAPLDDVTIPIDVLQALCASSLPLVGLGIGGDPSSTEAEALASVLRGEVFPHLRHLRLDTWRGVDDAVVEALATSPLRRELASLAVNFAGAAPVFGRHRDAFASVELVPLERVATTNAAGLCALGDVLLELGRPAEALAVFDDAHAMQSGRFEAARAGIERALAALGSARAVDDGDPVRDRAPSRLTRLMAWSAEARDAGRAELADRLLARVLAAVPDHAGAWAARAAAGDGDHEAALARAIAFDGDHLASACPPAAPDERAIAAVAAAYAALPSDASAALGALRDDEAGDASAREWLRVHRAIVATFALLALDRVTEAAATLDALEARAACPRTFALSWLARGFVEQARGRRDAAIGAWHRCMPPCFTPPEITAEIADEALSLRDGAGQVHTGEDEPYDQLVCSAASVFAAQLAGAPESAHARRDELREWLVDFGPLRPLSGLAFVPMVAMTARLFPLVQLDDVDGLLDLLAGLPGWRYRPKSAEHWRRR